MENAVLIDRALEQNTQREAATPIAKKPIYQAVKRCFDLVISLVALVVLALPMLVIALLIRLDSEGPVLFRQERMGKGGKIFVIYKFRTMRIDAPHDVASAEFEQAHTYITKIGGFLRRFSLDELPQFFNVLGGSMSVVGYRPVCLTETELNTRRAERGVFTVKPGITGLAQVSGRDNVSMDEKVELDARYVRQRSFKLDLWCILKTAIVVITGEGVM
jgi:O-antigen biosynthesis protein WbqP